MKILIIATNEKIPTTKYGGTERVIWDLGQELVRLGHKVSFLVKQGSVCDFADILIYDLKKPVAAQIPKGTDLIHSNTVIDLTDVGIPNIFTLHGNMNDSTSLKKLNNPVCISKNHAQRNVIKTYVHNGLNWSAYADLPINLKREYFHFLGKATWKVKNLKDAAKIAVKTKNELHVLGGKKWTYENLKKGSFWKVNTNIKYHGMVDNDTKMEIMSRSKGLIFPVKWHEPFGLAIIESMYAGCPVFGSKYGSLPELINDSVGFTSNSVEELIDAVQTKQFNPKDCRDYAVKHFSSQKMTSNYVALYERVLSGEVLD